MTTTSTTHPDPTSTAVRLVLDAPHFDAGRDWIEEHAEVRPHMFTGEPIEVWDFAAILERPWSSGERVALMIAADLFNGCGQALLSDVILSLDRELQERVLRALRIRVGLDLVTA